MWKGNVANQICQRSSVAIVTTRGTNPRSAQTKSQRRTTSKATKIALTVTIMVYNDNSRAYDDWEEFNFHQSNHKVNPTWILLDNCSTLELFCNRKLFTNVRNSDTTLKIHCNAGRKEVNQVGTLKHYGTV
jgi:hypothetical protein